MKIDVAIAALEKECFVSPWNLEMVQEQLKAPLTVLTVIIQNDELLGYALGIRSAYDCELYRIAVSKRYRNKGIGKQLMADFVQKCHAAGSTDIFLEVRSKNETAKRLYKNCNFYETGIRKDYYPDDDAVTFAYSKPQILYLIGFMGSGKSTTCKYLMEHCGMAGIDLDEVVEDHLNMGIKDIFSDYGEYYFRKVEQQLLYDLSSTTNTDVMALGGGTILNESNVQICKLFGKICYIDTPFETCYERIKGDPKRPIVAKLSKDELQSLYKAREKVYESVMDFHFDKSQFN